MENEVFAALDDVLEFSSKMIIRSLREQAFSDDEIKKIRASCQILKENGVYSFVTDNVTKRELLKQIQEFVEEGMKKSGCI